MSFKVTDFGINRKLICDFLLVINTNLPPIFHRFQVMRLCIFQRLCIFGLYGAIQMLLLLLLLLLLWPIIGQINFC